MTTTPLTIAWFSYFPVEWLPDLPPEVQGLPMQHPASWQRVLLEELQGRPDIRLHILVLRKQFKRDLSFERNGVVFHLLKTVGGLRAPSFFWMDTWLIGRRLKQIRPDVVHAWGTENGAALVANRLGYPRVITIQGLFLWYGQVIPLRPYQRFARMLESYSLGRAPLVTTESKFSVSFLRQRFPRLNVKQIEHAADPVFHAVKRRPPTKPLRLIFVGVFDYRKGADVLLAGLGRLLHVDFELLVVGNRPSPELLSTLPDLPAALWERIVFKGSLRPSEVADELATATMMVCPTRADVSPNAVKEAVVAGVPVVGTEVGGIPDYVVPDKNGVLFRPGDVDAFVRALETARKHPLFSQGLVDNSTLAQMREYLSPAVMRDGFMDAYREAVRR
jgi:glycosyltransferase involved in cell wall biosynthesis